MSIVDFFFYFENKIVLDARCIESTTFFEVGNLHARKQQVL